MGRVFSGLAILALLGGALLVDLSGKRATRESLVGAGSAQEGYCTVAQHDRDKVFITLAFGAGVLVSPPSQSAGDFSVLNRKSSFMRSFECAIAGPGKAMAYVNVRSAQSGRLLGVWKYGKLTVD